MNKYVLKIQLHYGQYIPIAMYIAATARNILHFNAAT